MKSLNYLLKILLLALLTAGLLATVSCQQKEEAKPAKKGAASQQQQGACPAAGGQQQGGQAMVGANPHAGMKPSHVVRVPETVEKTWQSVTINIKDKKTNQEKKVVIKIGDTYKIHDSDLSIRILHFLPNFSMDNFGMTSKSNEPKNPAVDFEVKKGEQKIFQGWLFNKFPDVHNFNHERYSFSLVDWQKK
jgi:hypothetical protein